VPAGWRAAQVDSACAEAGIATATTLSVISWLAQSPALPGSLLVTQRSSTISWPPRPFMRSFIHLTVALATSLLMSLLMPSAVPSLMTPTFTAEPLAGFIGPSGSAVVPPAAVVAVLLAAVVAVEVSVLLLPHPVATSSIATAAPPKSVRNLISPMCAPGSHPARVVFPWNGRYTHLGATARPSTRRSRRPGATPEGRTGPGKPV